MSVNKIRQKYTGSDAASVAKKLIKSWKKLLPGRYEAGVAILTETFFLLLDFFAAGPTGPTSSRETTPKSNKSGSNSPKSGTSATTTASLGKPGSPPPVTYSQQQSDTSSQGESTEGSEKNGSEKNGGNIPLRRLSSTSSDEIILNFPSSVDSYSRMASTGSDVRDRCRDLLAKALKKGLDEGITEDPMTSIFVAVYGAERAIVIPKPCTVWEVVMTKPTL